MPLLHDWELEITVDQVLRGQGADPQVVRVRRPSLVTAAERALAEGLPLIKPIVAYQRQRVSSVRHERIVLENGAYLSGGLVARQLASARALIAAVCTIGPALEELSHSYTKSDPLHSLALYGVGSAAAEALSMAVCNYFREQAEAENLFTTIPLSPGLEGWPVGKGQPEIFRLLPEAAEAGVTLLPSSVMLPAKSVSLVVGLVEEIPQATRVCDFCSLRETCRFQEDYAQAHG